MAGHLNMSLSESLQASLIIKHQEEKRQQSLLKQPPTGRQARTISAVLNIKKPPDLPEEIPLYKQCFLVMAFAGNEMSGAFGMIYIILFLEFVGVPTTLVTVEGIIGGSFTILFLPIFGYFSDRGSNLMIRKLKLTLISLIMCVLGFCGMATCSVVKLNQDTLPHNSTLHIFSSNSASYSSQQSQLFALGNNETKLPDPPKQQYKVPILGVHSTQTFIDDNNTSLKPIHIIAILSSAFLNIGFYTGMTVYRAFILEVSPPFLHNKLLIMTTIFSALGGLLVCVLSTIDFPTILGSAFDVDGTAVTVLMLCCSVLAFILISYAFTTLTGYSIYQKYQSKMIQGASSGRKNRSNSESDFHSDHKPRNYLRRKLLMRSKSISESSGGGNENDVTEPLLSSQVLDNRSYSTLSASSAASVAESEPHRPHNYYKTDGLDVHPYQKIMNPWEHSPSNVIHEGKVFDPPPTKRTMNMEDNDDGKIVSDDDDDAVVDHHKVDGYEEDEHHFAGLLSDDDLLDNSIDDAVNHNGDDSDDDEELLNDNNKHEHAHESRSEISNIYAAMQASYSTSVSMVYSSILGGHAHTRNSSFSGRMMAKPHGATSQAGPTIWKSKRLIVLIISIFFTMGTMVAFTTYNGNTLTIEVYHGDPSAPEGSKARQDYNRGLRGGAMGNLIMYSAYSFVCLINKKIIDILGEKIYYLLSQTACVAAIVTFILVKSSDTYFVASTVCGLYRGCAFTLGYIMVTKLVKEETSKPERNIGQIMAVIGLLVPTMFLIQSSMMGPLMAAFDSAWVPMVIAALNSGLALLVFSVFLIL